LTCNGCGGTAGTEFLRTLDHEALRRGHAVPFAAIARALKQPQILEVGCANRWLCEKLVECGDVVRAFTMRPSGHLGFLRVVNSPKFSAGKRWSSWHSGGLTEKHYGTADSATARGVGRWSSATSAESRWEVRTS